MAQVDPAQADHAGVGEVQVVDQVAQRRLARAGRPDQGDHLAGGQAELDAVEHRLAVVGEAHAVDLDQRAGRQRHGAGRLGPATGGGQHAARSGRCATTARGISSSRNPTTRMGKARMPNRAMACTSSPVVMVPVDTRQAPTASRAIVPEVGQGVEAGLEAGPQPPDPQARPRRLLGAAGAGHLAGLQAQRLDHQRALEGLVGHRGHVAQAGLGRAAGASTRRL